MLQSIEELSLVTRKLAIEIPLSAIENELNKAYKELRGSVNVPGFRKGKVPRTILQKRYAKSVEADVIGKLVPEYYAEAVKESGIIPVTQPSIEGDIKITMDSPLLFSVTVEVRPELKDLNYEGIEIEKQEATVTEEDIQNEMEWLQSERATYEPSDKELEEKGMAVIDYAGFIDGEPVKDLEQLDYQFVLGSQMMPEEFKAALLNKKKDDTCEFSMTFPDDFHNKIIAGKTVDFKVQVKEVKKQVTQPIDDEFAKDLGYETLEEMRKAVESRISQNKNKAVEEHHKRQLFGELLKRHELEAPPTLVEEQLNLFVAREKNYAGYTGIEIPSDDSLKASLRDKAIQEVKYYLILSSIGKAENIDVKDEDVEIYFKQLALERGVKPEDIKKHYISQDGSLEVIKNEIYNNRVLDLILSKSHFKERT